MTTPSLRPTPPRQLLDGPILSFVRSPDETVAAEVHPADTDGHSDISLVNLKGETRRLTNFPMDGAQPQWSPDGAQIVFWSSRTGNMQIYVINNDGSGLERLTNYAFHDENPSWSR